MTIALLVLIFIMHDNHVDYNHKWCWSRILLLQLLERDPVNASPLCPFNLSHFTGTSCHLVLPLVASFYLLLPLTTSSYLSRHLLSYSHHHHFTREALIFIILLVWIQIIQIIFTNFASSYLTTPLSASWLWCLGLGRRRHRNGRCWQYQRRWWDPLGKIHPYYEFIFFQGIYKSLNKFN